MINQIKIRTIAKQFKKEAIVPFWMWNDRLEKGELKRQLHEIKDKGMNQVIIHPRFGLETVYLSENWFEMVGCVIGEAKKERMGIWIYDELNWPSGYAGGEVLKNHPEFQAKNLIKTKGGFAVKNTSWKPAYSQGDYIDVLNPEAVQEFINTVYERYWRRFKKDFGHTVLGFFTDEPGFYNNFSGSDPNSIPWTEKLPAFFRSENGYQLEPNLDKIFDDFGQRSIETRVDFWRTVSMLYKQSYFQKLQNWCHKKNVAFIGHVLMEEDLVNTVKTQGSFFTAMECLDFAGYDLLGKLTPTTLVAAKLADSARKTFGLGGVCAETFGIFGWDLEEKEMNQVVGWQAKLGLDVLVPHALYYSLRGERNNDCPPSFMAEKYWKNFSRFVKNSRRQISNRKETKIKVAIYYPIETVWGRLSPFDTKKAEVVDKAFKIISFACYNIGVGFDYISGNHIKRRLAGYKYLVLPMVEVLDLVVLEEINKFVRNGGGVIVLGEKPKLATKVVHQDRFENLLTKLDSKINYIILPEYKTAGTDKLKRLFSKWLSPIWLARGIRLARYFGYARSTIQPNQLTGIESELQKIIC